MECVADELESKHDGKFMKSIFPKMAGTKAGETVVFSWITLGGFEPIVEA